MSLFVMNRYGDEEERTSKGEEDHLSALLQRIAERKKQKAAATVVDEGTDKDKNDGSPVSKKRKKQKLSKVVDSVRLTENESSNIPVYHSVNNHVDKCSEKSEESNVPVHVAEDTSKESVKKSPDFMVLGSESYKKKEVVNRVLPDWLSHPEIISADLNSGPSLKKLKSILNSELIDILKANGIKKLFPVQMSTISCLLKFNKDREMGWWPRDVCVSAPTGSGKTLAYVLPIVQQLQNRLVRKVRCLVVLPVQELAAQVHKVMLKYTAHTKLKVALLSGASPFEQEQTHLIKKTDREKFVSRVDIVVATPGRLLDHLRKTIGFSLAALRFLVIDEADRATDWLQRLGEPHLRSPLLNLANICSSKNPPAQKLLFSATLSQDPEKLSRLGLFQPILFTSIVSDKDEDLDLDKVTGNFIGRYTSPDELTERAVECSAEYKPLALCQLLIDNLTKRALVFTNSGKNAHRLAILSQSLLKNKSIIVGEMSGQLTPKQREDVLKKFIEGEIHVLVSSDALARGLDIPGVSLVISYDLPKHIKGYIHRAGRTGRAGTLGTAVSILTPNQVGIFNRMLSAAYKTVPKVEALELEIVAEVMDYQGHVERLKESLDKEHSEELQRLKVVKRKHGSKS